MPWLTIASGRPACSTDRLDDAVYPVRDARGECGVVSSRGIEAVFSGGAATNEVVSSGGTAVAALTKGTRVAWEGGPLEPAMPDRMTLADRYRKVAADSSELAKNASSDFLRRYYEGLAERYLLLAERELAVAERQVNAASLQPGSSGLKGHEFGRDPVALVPSQEIGRTISGDEAEKVVGRSDGPQTVPKRRKSKKRPRPEARR
jgi:hypothetical protein